MTFNITKEWCLKMAALEGDAEISAGRMSIDPAFSSEPHSNSVNEEPAVAFGRFVSLMRRKNGLTVERLSDAADVDVSEIVSIEELPSYRPEVRTVHQLANFFKVPRGNLLQIAGLTSQRDGNLMQESVRFAARSETNAKLTEEERIALEAFVAILSDKK